MASTINEVEVYRMMDEIAGLKAKLAQQERNANDVAKSYDKKLAQAYESIGIKESTQRIIKEWQLFAGEKATENAQIAEQLEFTVRVAQDWLSRAEAAEARVAELEARLAGEAWRPVTEKPESPGDYLVYTWPGECEVVMFDSDGYWQTTPVTHWQPLPAPPIDPQDPA